MHYWILGFMWGSARFSGDYLLVQSRRKDWIEKVKDDISSDRTIFPVITNRGCTSWRLKLPTNHEYVRWMLEKGYEGRQGNEERNMPFFSNLEDEAEFFQGYFAPHHTLDMAKNKKDGRTFRRLRFYAALPIVERLNQHLHNQIGTGLKKPQKHGQNDVCKILYYTSSTEVPLILEYLKLED